MMRKSKNNVAVFAKHSFEIFLNRISEQYKVFHPLRTKTGIEFVENVSANETTFDYSNTKIPPKIFFLPQAETLFTFDAARKEIKQLNDKKTNGEKPVLLLGVRPCDAKSITFLDKIFAVNDPKDPYYIQRRKTTRIISVACTHPRSTCFCTAVGCGPDSEIGSDLIIFELYGRYLVKAVTKEGKELFEKLKDIMIPLTKNDFDEIKTTIDNARRKLKMFFNVEDIKRKFKNFDAPYLVKCQQKCLGCGICTYMCPTCYCFDITDEVIESSGKRVRNWDSCLFSLFTLHASGHNPRPTQRERLRQRIRHKFNYAFECNGNALCVGCGRCIIDCPVNIDIREIIKEAVETK